MPVQCGTCSPAKGVRNIEITGVALLGHSADRLRNRLSEGFENLVAELAADYRQQFRQDGGDDRIIWCDRCLPFEEIEHRWNFGGSREGMKGRNRTDTVIGWRHGARDGGWRQVRSARPSFGAPTETLHLPLHPGDDDSLLPPHGIAGYANNIIGASCNFGLTILQVCSQYLNARLTARRESRGGVRMARVT